MTDFYQPKPPKTPKFYKPRQPKEPKVQQPKTEFFRKTPRQNRALAVAEALALNPKARFYQGLPCKHGHIGLRYIADGHCLHCKEERYAKVKNKPVDRYLG